MEDRVGWELVQSDHPAQALAAFVADRGASVLVLSTHRLIARRPQPAARSP